MQLATASGGTYCSPKEPVCTWSAMQDSLELSQSTISHSPAQGIVGGSAAAEVATTLAIGKSRTVANATRATIFVDIYLAYPQQRRLFRSSWNLRWRSDT